MNAEHQHLELAQLRPGMIISDELLDRQGDVLLARGAVLTAPAIATLAGHGIGTVAVQLAPEGAPAGGKGAVQARLDRLFRHNDPDDDGDRATGILRAYIGSYRLGREAGP